jgi:hypothetical protein
LITSHSTHTAAGLDARSCLSKYAHTSLGFALAHIRMAKLTA